MTPGFYTGLLMWREDGEHWTIFVGKTPTAHAARPVEPNAAAQSSASGGQLAEPQSCQVFRIVPVDTRALEAAEITENGQAFAVGKKLPRRTPAASSADAAGSESPPSTPMRVEEAIFDRSPPSMSMPVEEATFEAALVGDAIIDADASPADNWYSSWDAW